MKFWQQSLTAKVAHYFLLLSLITVGVVGSVAYLRARNALRAAAFERLNVAATLKEAEINRWFEEQQRDFLLTTQLPDVQTNLNILLDKTTSERDYQTAYTIISQYLLEVFAIKPNLREIFILDRSNKIICSTNKQREGEYEILANITYVEEVKLGDNFAPIFYVSPFTGKPAVTLAKPIRNQQGIRQGIVLVDLNLERIDRIVRESTGLGESGETYLVGSLVSKNSFIARDIDNTEEFPEGISSPGIDAAMNGISGHGLYRNYKNSPVLGVYRWLNDQDLALLVETDRNEAFAPARQLASNIIAVGLVSVFGLLLGINWLSRQLFLSRQQLEDYSHQLELKAEEAEAANRAKSLFLANMSHELRTPLNAILGFAQLMDRDVMITPQQQDSLAIINRSGEHLLNLINDVLEMSKIEAGRIVVNAEAFDLHQLLQTIREMFQIRAEEKQLSLNFSLAPDLPRYIVSDRRKLRQVITNLLSNAVKFTHTGGVTLRVASDLTNTANTSVKLLFEVEDTGKGIASNEMSKLFQPFVQTLVGIKSEGGTGLGLAISRQFVQLMGGDIHVNSRLGQGSTFYFNTEVLLAEAPAIDNLSSYKRVIQIAPGQPSYRILVVDDRQENRDLLTQLLQTVGFYPRTAKNGLEAVELWQEWHPHLVWMDIRMPVMDGYAATQKIKQLQQQEQKEETVIIALTASAFEEQKAKILAAGCDDFVSKPFQEQVIFDKMSQYLGIKYIYAEKSVTNEAKFPTIAHKSLEAQDLDCMSSEWINKLYHGAIAVDADLIVQLISKIPPNNRHLATSLGELIHNYDFDHIVELCETKKVRSSEFSSLR